MEYIEKTSGFRVFCNFEMTDTLPFRIILSQAPRWIRWTEVTYPHLIIWLQSITHSIRFKMLTLPSGSAYPEPLHSITIAHWNNTISVYQHTRQFKTDN